MKYHKQSDGSTSYCYQCYKQKRLGSTKTRIKKGLDTSDSCDIPVVQEWKLILMSNIIFNTIPGKPAPQPISNNVLNLFFLIIFNVFFKTVEITKDVCSISCWHSHNRICQCFYFF